MTQSIWWGSQLQPHIYMSYMINLLLTAEGKN